jgi:hypothetical protein
MCDYEQAKGMTPQQLPHPSIHLDSDITEALMKMKTMKVD